MQMVWDPIYADDLRGYPVWKRAEGAGGEFTRISIPFSRQEVKKLPMTPRPANLFASGPGPYGIRGGL